MINTKYRTDDSEIMDDFALEGAILQNALDKIASINQLLGGNKITLYGVKALLSDKKNNQSIRIVDIGCGNGDMLRFLADYANRENKILELIGIDANAFTVKHAENLSREYPNISYRCEDVFSENFENLKYDILICTLTLHHFKDDQILQLLRIFIKNSSIGLVINDLHRSKIAYRLFQILCFIFRLNEMSRKDGLVSILRGFKKTDLLEFSKKLSLNNDSITWRWAFRYQWIIKNN